MKNDDVLKLLLAILDIQCIFGNDSKYVIKEMSVVDMKLWATQHWLFKYLSGTQNGKFRSVNKRLGQKYHQISLEYCDGE